MLYLRTDRINGVSMLEARLWVKKNGKNFIGKGRIELLELIQKHGSIHAAAKAIKMSYKAAWDSVDAMNKLSNSPLVEKTSGGKGGGGTVVTKRGEEIIHSFHLLDQKHRKFLDLFSENDDLISIATIIDQLTLKLSARNQLSAIITNIKEDSVNVLIEMTLKGSEKLYASITKSSFSSLACSMGDPIVAIIKASSVLLSKTPPAMTCENLVQGKVAQVLRDTSGVEISIRLASENTFTATLKNETFDTLGICVNDDVYAFFSASNIIIGV